jgi:AcrR family transcriptional regulator
MARKGIGATSIQEITDTADVGFGSFYNHFGSKEDIAQAVMEDAIESFGDAADRLAEKIADPAEVLAASVRHAVRRAAADEAWAGFSCAARSLGGTGSGAASGSGSAGHPDRRPGAPLQLDDPPATMLAAGGAILGIIAGRLQGEIGEDAPERAAAVVLRLLGVPSREGRSHREPPAAVDRVMRLATFTHGGSTRVGVVTGDEIADVGAVDVMTFLARREPAAHAPRLKLAEVRLEAPVRPRSSSPSASTTPTM